MASWSNRREDNGGRRWSDQADYAARLTLGDLWRVGLVIVLLVVAHRIGSGGWGW